MMKAIKRFLKLFIFIYSFSISFVIAILSMEPKIGSLIIFFNIFSLYGRTESLGKLSTWFKKNN